ncbi:MAG: tetratricopeptide repeat protein [Chthoniobacterales bacterium]
MSKRFFPTAAAILGFAAAALGHGDLHEAIDGVSRAITAAPRDATLLLRRAELRRLHGEFAAAEADYASVRRLRPDLTIVEFGLAALRHAQGRDDDALPLLDRFLRSTPEHPGARVLRAEILEKRGAWEKAEADLAVAAPAEPHYATKRAELLARHGRFEDAARCLDEASRARGRVPVLEQQALEMEERAGDTESALRRLDRLIAQEPRPDLWLARKASLLTTLGRGEEAKAAWQEATTALEKVPTEKRNLEMNRSLAAQIEAGLAAPAALAP